MKTVSTIAALAVLGLSAAGAVAGPATKNVHSAGNPPPVASAVQLASLEVIRAVARGEVCPCEMTSRHTGPATRLHPRGRLYPLSR